VSADTGAEFTIKRRLYYQQREDEEEEYEGIATSGTAPEPLRLYQTAASLVAGGAI